MDPIKATPITMLPAVSSQIAAIGYDLSSQTLAIEFNNSKGRVYHYKGVDPATWDAFLAAKSKSGYFEGLIRGQYAYDRVEPDGTISKTVTLESSPEPEAA